MGRVTIRIDTATSITTITELIAADTSTVDTSTAAIMAGITKAAARALKVVMEEAMDTARAAARSK